MIAALLLLLAAQAPPPPTPSFDQVSKQAAAARERADFDKAIALYRQALKLHPNWMEGWWSLGTIFYDQDRYPDGRDAFRRAAALDPKNAKAFALLGLCEYRTKEYAPSLGHLNHARLIGLAGVEPQMIQVLMYHTGILLTRFEQYEAAMQVIVELVKQGSSGPNVVEAAGLAALRKPLVPAELPPADRELVFLAGRAVVSASERNVADAQTAFDELVAAYPKAPNVHYTYGAYLMLSDPDAGLREMQSELEVSPDHLPALVAIALEYVKRGEPAQGRAYAAKAVKTGPASFAAHAAMGRVLVDTGDLADGIEELEQAERLAPQSPQVRIALASAYGRAGRPADAARERSEFLKLKNDSEPSFTPAKQP